MDFRELFFVLSAICFAVGNSLKCKCTQSSWKTPCDDGLCEVPTGESSCLMLDHPVSGRHYACSQSRMENGECLEKVTKSGATVNVCSCDTSDFCNFKMWPSDDPTDPPVENSAQFSTKIITSRNVNSSISSRYYGSILATFIFSILPICLAMIL